MQPEGGKQFPPFQRTDRNSMPTLIQLIAEVRRNIDRAAKLGNYLAKRDRRGTGNYITIRKNDVADWSYDKAIEGQRVWKEKNPRASKIDYWETQKPTKISVSSLRPTQPYTYWNEKTYREKKSKDTRPIRVVKHDYEYRILDGHHRWMDHKLRGEKEIDAIVMDADRPGHIKEMKRPRWEIPDEPGTKPIPKDHVRLYHQTGEKNLNSIRRTGIQLSKAKGYEGPKAIYADPKGFYGKPDDRPTAEFHVHKDDYSRPFVRRKEVKPSEIVAAHKPWHKTVRYIEDNPRLKKEVEDGKHDDIIKDRRHKGSNAAKAVRFILKRKKAAQAMKEETFNGRIREILKEIRNSTVNSYKKKSEDDLKWANQEVRHSEYEATKGDHTPERSARFKDEAEWLRKIADKRKRGLELVSRRKEAKAMKEETNPYDLTHKSLVDIEARGVKNNINQQLDAVTSQPCLSPYIAWVRIAKVLAYYHIFLPRIHFMTGSEGTSVHRINQFGQKFGMKDNGDVVTAPPSEYSLFFRYSSTGNGLFNIFCRVVDDETLHTLENGLTMNEGATAIKKVTGGETKIKTVTGKEPKTIKITKTGTKIVVVKEET